MKLGLCRPLVVKTLVARSYIIIIIKVVFILFNFFV